MNNINITKVNGLRYADSVGDRNEIHRSDELARKYGLSCAIVPGMWLASHIQGRSGISGIKNIKFSGNVFYGESVLMEESVGRGGKDFVFKRGNDVVCSVSGVRGEKYSALPREIGEVAHIYDADVCRERTGLYLRSIGFSSEVGEFPEMFLASLSAPALLSLGNQKGITGMHVSQSFDMHNDYKEGVVKVVIGDEKIKGPLNFYELRWLQNEKIVASGRACVLPLKDGLEVKVGD